MRDTVWAGVFLRRAAPPAGLPDEVEVLVPPPELPVIVSVALAGERFVTFTVGSVLKAPAGIVFRKSPALLPVIATTIVQVEFPAKAPPVNSINWVPETAVKVAVAPQFWVG